MRRRYKFVQSLLSHYWLLLLAALLFIPVAIPASLFASWAVNRIVSPPADPPVYKYGTAYDIEQMWHGEAERLREATDADIDTRLTELKQEYPDASLFWIDGEGNTRLQLPESPDRPARWTADEAVAFMKKRTGDQSEPFTVVAFVGGMERVRPEMMVLELPRSLLSKSYISFYGNRDTAYFGYILAAMFVFYAAISYGFIHRIRRRLLKLEAAMSLTGHSGIPQPVPIDRPDEIGQLEAAFNAMVDELTRSKQREKEEEALRQRLIGSISHDLRTPLTVIGSHLYTLAKEPLTDQGRQSVALMEQRIGDLDRLLDHLLSYNLLASGRYALSLKRTDVLRIVRECAAAWYPLWEKEGIEAELALPDAPLVWTVDEQGFRRVLDNLFQNVVRHAREGGYIGIVTEQHGGRTALAIVDRGGGFSAEGGAKGAGLGLAIVGLLLKQMKLKLEIDSSQRGTRVSISPDSDVSTGLPAESRSSVLNEI